jgi:hypothetical protein
VTTIRSVAHLSGAWLAAFTCWLVVEARVDPLAAIAPAALRALVLAQSLMIALWLPSVAPADAREHVEAAVLSAVAPAPFGAILWLSGAVPVASLARAGIALLAFALVISCSARLVVRSAPFAAFTRAGLQVALLALLWRLREAWLAPLLA